MKIAVIGACGWAGIRHLEAYRSLGHEVAYVVDPSPRCQQLALHFGAQALSDARALYDVPLDAASIALRPDLQPEICMKLIEKGCAVLCEKPVAPNAIIANALKQKVEQTDYSVFMPAYLLRFHPVYRRVSDLLLSGELGNLLSINIRSQVTKTGIEGWRNDRSIGGVTMVNAVHSIDLVNWLIGAAAEPVYAAAGNRYLSGDTEDWIEASMRGPNQEVINLQAGWWPFVDDDESAQNDEGWVRRLRVETEREILVQRHNGLLRIRRDGPDLMERVVAPDLFSLEVQHFIDCTMNRSRPTVTVRDNQRAQLTVDAVLKLAGIERK